MIAGEALAALEDQLPAVSLILGPPGSGKGQLARHLVREYPASDVVLVTEVGMEEARMVARAAQYAGSGGAKVFVISLDGATEHVQNALLKSLEEAPDHARFVLIASAQPLPTITSRSHVFRVGSAQGLTGREFDVPVRSVTSAAVRAAMSGEWEAMPRLARGWTASHSLCLSDWSREAVSGRWKSYTEGFAPGVTREQATVIWKLTSQAPDSPAMSHVALHRAFARR